LEVRCPECGTRDVRTSHARSFADRLRALVGIYNVKCKRCDARFRGALWNPLLLFYARCPRCLRTELSKWSEEHYNPPTLTIAKLRLGASPLRCDFCRCNFASFRVRKRRFSWHKDRPAASRPTLNT